MQPTNNEITVFIIIATILILSLVIFMILILLLYQKKQLAFLKNVESLKLDHEKNLLKTRLEIQEHTFQNISREIHDNIGLSLTLAKLNLNVLDFEKIEKSQELINSSVELISKSINDLSDISKSLNSDGIAQQGLLKALELEMDRIKKINKFRTHFKVLGNPVFFDSQKELVLYRIAQEALNNVIKHSSAQDIFMTVCFNSGSIRLSVKDNGKGFLYSNNQEAFQRERKAGLTNMQLRAALINGDMEVDTEIGKGTVISVTAAIDTLQN
jgi:two-component system, NarL family, sensor kinase